MRPIARPALILSILLGAACSGGTPSAASSAAPSVPSVEQIGETLGTVNGLPIGTKEFDIAASKKAGREDLDDNQRGQVMQELVGDKLLYQEALRRGIDRDPKIQKMIVNTLLKDAVYNSIRTSDIADAELNAYFDEHKDDFVVPEKIQIKRILLKAEAGEDPAATRARAEKVLAEVKAAPDDFRNAAVKYSQDQYGRRGGDLGFLTMEGKPGVDPKIVEQAFTLEKGAISDLFETSDGWNIVTVPNKRERVERTFDQMKGSVLRKVKSDRYKKLQTEFVAKLRQGAVVELDDARVKAHKIEYVRPIGPPGAKIEVPGMDEDAPRLPGGEGDEAPAIPPSPTVPAPE